MSNIRYFVVGDDCRTTLNRVVDTLSEERNEQEATLVPGISQATHLLVMAQGDADVQETLWKFAKHGKLPDLPVVVLLTDYLEVWEISLATAMVEEEDHVV